MLNDEVVFTLVWNLERPRDRNDERLANRATAEKIDLILPCLVRGKSLYYRRSHAANQVRSHETHHQYVSAFPGVAGIRRKSSATHEPRQPQQEGSDDTCRR